MSLIGCALIKGVYIKRVLIESGLKKRVLLSLFLFIHVMIMSDPTLILFGMRLRELRKIKGISQEKLALQSDIARSYLGEVERGKRNIALLNIQKLADALGIEASELLKKPNSTNQDIGN